LIWEIIEKARNLNAVRGGHGEVTENAEQDGGEQESRESHKVQIKATAVYRFDKVCSEREI
jgi:hypothetical protein